MGTIPRSKILRNIAKAQGIDLTIIVDIIHVIEYLWKAGRVFHPESGPELEQWVEHRLRKNSSGKGRTHGWRDAPKCHQKKNQQEKTRTRRQMRHLPAQ